EVGVRGPQRVPWGPRRRGRSAGWSALKRVRGAAPGADWADGRDEPRPAWQPVSVSAGCGGERGQKPGGDFDDASHGGGSMGQHRQLYLYNRANRQQWDGG